METNVPGVMEPEMSSALKPAKWFYLRQKDAWRRSRRKSISLAERRQKRTGIDTSRGFLKPFARGQSRVVNGRRLCPSVPRFELWPAVMRTAEAYLISAISSTHRRRQVR
jgi:hypothetical protein